MDKKLLRLIKKCAKKRNAKIRWIDDECFFIKFKLNIPDQLGWASEYEGCDETQVDIKVNEAIIKGLEAGICVSRSLVIELRTKNILLKEAS